ncbi:MAG: polysaccharide biosynthesis C-terminal domain-containing protein [Carnobacterium sp.]|uniref:lipopolysaccharide biosynthesis protein n=1 Tax=Carnobacterium sp. TaxID=48221 RepID=UPI003C71E39A
MGKTQVKIFLNMGSGLFVQALLIIIGLVFPKLFIENFGSEVNGLVASITQVYSYMILLEAGVGQTSLQALYSPVAKNNHVKINGILSASKMYYNRASYFYLLAVILISLIFPITIDIPIPYNQVVMVSLFTGLSGFIRFKNNAVKLNLLRAEGKEYVVSYFTNYSQIFIYLLKITLIFFGVNIIILQLTDLIITFIQSLVLKGYFNWNYKHVSFREIPIYESLRQSKSVIIHQVSGLIFNSTDVIFLTYFTNFTVVSVYMLYNMITNAVNMITIQISTTFNFILGQSIDGDRKKLINKFDMYEVIYLSISFALATTLYVLFEPFISSYTQGFSNAEAYLDEWIALLFSTRLILVIGRTPFQQLIEASGHFKETQIQSIIEAALNLIVSLILVIQWGVKGVLIGTIIATIYRTTDMIVYSNRNILKRSPLKNLIKWASHLILFIFIVILNQSFIANRIEIQGILHLFIYAVMVLAISFTLNVLVDVIFFKSSIVSVIKLGKKFF